MAAKRYCSLGNIKESLLIWFHIVCTVKSELVWAGLFTIYDELIKGQHMCVHVCDGVCERYVRVQKNIHVLHYTHSIDIVKCAVQK